MGPVEQEAGAGPVEQEGGAGRAGGNPTLLSEIYTKLYITEGGGGEISDEHEVRWIEKTSRKAAKEDIPINLIDIFTPLVS